MPIHRFRGLFGSLHRRPNPMAMAPMSGGFVVCPLPISLHSGNLGGWATELYRLAYEQAWNDLASPSPCAPMFASMN